MKIRTNTYWSVWNLLPALTIGCEDFFGETERFVALGWGPFEIELVW